MTVRLSGEDIVLSGACPVEEAEMLLRLLCGNPQAAVDWGRCEEAHAAVIQVLLAARPRLLGPPAGAFLRERIAPLLGG